jgi:hypothetical protein
MSIIRKAFTQQSKAKRMRRLLDRLADPREFPFMEDVGNELLDLCHAGQLDATEAELAEIVGVVGRRREEMMAAWWARNEALIKAQEAEERYQEHKEAALARIWAICGWNQGAPDGSGPVFALDDPDRYEPTGWEPQEGRDFLRPTLDHDPLSDGRDGNGRPLR